MADQSRITGDQPQVFDLCITSKALLEQQNVDNTSFTQNLSANVSIYQDEITTRLKSTITSNLAMENCQWKRY